MDRRLLDYYNRELQHIRSAAEEFSKEFPKVAERLGLQSLEVADPYVERLVEGFAFLTARVQLKLDAEFPRFTQSLMETVYPHYLAPTPSMAIVRYIPDFAEGSLADGFRLKRGTSLRSLMSKGQQTACEYRTAHDVNLLPLKISEAEYYTRNLGALQPPRIAGLKAAIRLRLQATAGLTATELNVDDLTFFLSGADETPMKIYEQILAHTKAVVVQPVKNPAPWQHVVEKDAVHRVGFDDDEALLPYGARSFHGYRLVHEYFAFPQRFLFVKTSGLKEGFDKCMDSELDLIFLLDEANLDLEHSLDLSNFELFCTPAINLFPKRADRIHVSDRYSEFHVVPDRTRPLDYEVFQVHHVSGYRDGAQVIQEFRPFYLARDDEGDGAGRGAYFAMNRVPRVASEKEKLVGRRSSYGGSECYVSLVDAQAAPYPLELRQLAVETTCTNRDLPIRMPVGRGRTDFTMEEGAPVDAIRCIAGPTLPKPTHVEGEFAWRAISHLSLNYLSLIDSDESMGASALRDLLKLYADASEAHIRKQIEGVRSVRKVPIVRRAPTKGPITFVRGIQIDLELEELAFEGTGVFLLGAVLEQFFAKYVSLNSFTETVVSTPDRGEIMRWPARIGLRHSI